MVKLDPRRAIRKYDHTYPTGKKHLFRVRHKTSDTDILNQVDDYFRHVSDFTGDTVLDIGGHIGGFTVGAILHGASKVYTVEPTPTALDVLEKNIAGFEDKVTLYEGAVVGHRQSPTVTLLINKGLATGRNSTDVFGTYTILKKNQIRHKVKAIDARKLYGYVRPTVIKLDCEGAEYDILLNGPDIPNSVHTVIMELHHRGHSDNERGQIEFLFRGWEAVKPDSDIMESSEHIYVYRR